MFTGIITNLGRVFNKTKTSLIIKTDKDFLTGLEEGTSIAINGVCLTVTSKPSFDSFSIELMPETLKRTMLGKLKVDDLVNLELPVSTHTLLSGHIVQGHVDGVGQVEDVKKDGNSRLLTIKIPAKLSRYLVEKGSIAVNGISLTVIEAGEDFFTVGTIPYTWKHTMLHQAQIGDLVNIEVDILAKYLEKLIVRKE